MNYEITKIDRIEFKIFRNNEVKAYSVTGDNEGIDVPESYENNEPKRGGLIDPRLGTTNHNILCATCNLNDTRCPGHFGHIELAEKVFNYCFFKHVKSLLQCICIHCSNPLLNLDFFDKNITTFILQKKSKARFIEIKKLVKNINYCKNCNKQVPKIKKENRFGVLYYNAEIILDQTNEKNEKNKKIIREILNAERCYAIFQNITDDQYRFLGFNPNKSRPEDLIIKIFPFPPITIRPSVKADYLGGDIKDSSLTTRLANIIKANKNLKKSILKEQGNNLAKYKNDKYESLQYHIATFCDTDRMPKSEDKNGKQVISIASRLHGKNGRIRSNLLGKRVDFSARTVITSDPFIGLNEVGVPIKIAMILTFPEIVTSFNIDKLTKIVLNGKNTYPGANYVITTFNDKKQQIDLRYGKNIVLKYGDIVERHLIDGDNVLLNRQPSLHKMSMMCHTIRVINDPKYNTFRINSSITKPYNADFDGDEMNIFIPQSLITSYEIKEIADAKLQIITPRYSKPLIGLVQDSILGVYKLTLENKMISWNDIMNISSYLNINNKYRIKKDGNARELFSMLLFKNTIINDGINIKNGKLINGSIMKSGLNNILISYIFDKYGSEETKLFIDNVQKLILNWLMIEGMTVGYGDTLISKEIYINVKTYMEEIKLKVSNMITELENNPDLNDPISFEKTIQSMLELPKANIGGKIIEGTSQLNNFRIMIDSGSKGAKLNLGQIIGGLGQDLLKFKRIEKKVNGRTLPHFHYNDDTPDARGFITNSYREGLNPTEFFFHHMTAREGLIDTAIKSVSGDTQIIIIEKNELIYISIGVWIDNLIDNNKFKVYINDDNNEYREFLKLFKNVYIPTINLKGEMILGQITAITRHNPSKIMYKIRTKSGRIVTVTDSHSLLVWNENKNEFERKEPQKINIGQYVPVSTSLPPFPKDLISLNIHLTYLTKSNIIIQKYINSIFQYNQFKSFNEIDIYCINMLLNKINLFANIEYDIENNLYTLIINNDYKIINNVILDPIIDIIKIDNNNFNVFNKVYDLTIPSTMHFGIANGLHIVDTSNTGYMQRKLIKSMEDVMICYDGTVRNAINNIIQFTYSNSNLDQTKQKKVKLNLINLNNIELTNKYIFSNNEINDLSKELKIEKKKLINFNQEYSQHIFKLRDLFRKLYSKFKNNQKIIENDFFQPVHYKRLIDDIITNQKNEKSDLNPIYIYEQIQYILKPNVTRLLCMSDKQIQNNTVKIIDDKIYKTLFEFAINEYLCPKRCIYEYILNKEQFDNLVINIINGFNKAIVEPGEMVGIITSQSFGESLTQLTLNSVDWNEYIYYRINDNIVLDNIGNIIDNELNNPINKNKILYYDDNNTEYLDIKDKNIYTISTDDNGIMYWKQIEAITRHLPNGKLINIKTNSGRIVSATKGHSFLVYQDNKVIPKLGSEIKIGDKVPIMYKYPKTENLIDEIDGVILNYDNGYKMGYCKFLDPNMLLTNIEFIKGFITGYLDIKYIEKNIQIINKKLHINNVYNNEYNQKDIFSVTKPLFVPLLAEIFAKINIFVSINMNNLILNNYNFNILLNQIDLQNEAFINDIIQFNVIIDIKKNKYEQFDVIFDEIKEITKINSSHPKVYDLTIKDTRNFTIFGGLCVRDTFHSTGSGVIGMLGVPRFQEILNNSKNIATPGMAIYLKNEYKNNYDIAKKLASSIIYVNLIKIIDSGYIIYDPIDINNNDNYMISDNIVIEDIFYQDNNNKHLEYLSWLFRFKLNKDNLLKYDITLLDIKSEFIKFWTAADFLSKKKKKENNKLNNVIIGSTFENVEDIIIHIRFDIYNIDMDYLYELYEILTKKFTIKGIKDIKEVLDIKKEKYLYFDEDGNKIDDKEEYVIYTEGVNLEELKNYKIIDFSRTKCNDIAYNHKHNGLEVAKKSIIREIENVFPEEMNYNHIELIADVMTIHGNITSIDRHGAGKTDIEPLTRASFEKPLENFINAAIFNETDHLKNVSARIMVGKPILGGTGLCDVLLDVDMILNSDKGSSYQLESKINYLKENILLKKIQDRHIDELYIP